MSNFIKHDFEPSSAAAWKQRIQVDLKGADFNETLLTQTNEGITIKPFYHLDNFEKLSIPETNSDFTICQQLNIKSEAAVNSKALDAIDRGANALKFMAKKPFNLKTVCNKLLNRNIEFHFQLDFLSKEFVLELAELLKNETVYYNIDPIGNLAKSGNWYASFKDDLNAVSYLQQKMPTAFLFSVNVDTYQNAGANTVQQIAYALAHANEYLTYLGGDIAPKIQFNFAIGSNYFFEISKIRAFRYLYNLMLSAYNVSASAAVFAAPSMRNKTIYDYNVNMLRTTTECMSAILGGANTISNCAYDTIFNDTSEFGDRIARNQLLILREESYFTNENHIATNSYYIESITKQLAEKALTIFKEIEKSGGFLRQLKEGIIQRKIQENAKKEQTQFDAGELVLVGSNKFPNAQDTMKHALPKNPFGKSNPQKTLIIPVIPKRLCETLEQKRLKNEP